MSNEEIVGGPFAVWIADPNEPAPELDAAPAAGWTLLGKNGAANISEDGITINWPNTTDLWRALGTTLPVKAFTSEEDISLEFDVADMRAETIAHSLAKDPTATGVITTTAPGAGQIGIKSVDLYRGFAKRQVALLLRGDGQSPELDVEDAVYNSQLWLPRALQVGAPSIVIVKNEPQLLHFMFQVLYDATNTPTFTYQNAAATS